uniref:Uncharacterized protein n=1 Tax=viral metagenome TaxID=1070528 RepID=A0A6C0DTV1_9ZZZZ
MEPRSSDLPVFFITFYFYFYFFFILKKGIKLVRQ